MPSLLKLFPRRAAVLSTLVVAASFSLTGCGMGPANTSTPEQSLHLNGLVHGGNNPVSGAIIGLYRAGSTGYGSAATNILTQSVTTDASGFFGLTGLYTCNAASDQMYITATQGNPGLGTSATNPALAMVAALGNCGDLNANTYITINEITTVAAAWSLAQFSTDFAHIGTSATNAAGLKNSFLDAQLIASSSTGQLPTLISTQTTEPGKILALADALAPCINSLGNGPCTSLFAAATPPNGGTAPTDTFTAALNIVKNPANNVAAVFNNIPSNPPFPTTLTAAPNEWTLSMTLTGGGIAAPTAIAIDQLGNVWVAGYFGVLSAYTPQGVPFSGSGFGLGGFLSEVYGLAVDNLGNVWATDEEIPSHNGTKGCAIAFQGAYTPSSTALGSYLGLFQDNSIQYPESIATDPQGRLYVANYGNASANAYQITGGGTGTLLKAGLGAGSTAFPVAITADNNGGLWLGNQQDARIAHDLLTGGAAYAVNCCSGADGLAMDNGGNVWAANYYDDSVSQVSSTGTIRINGANVAGLASPAGLAVDGRQNLWAANYHGGSISEVAGINGTLAAGTGISPASNNSLGTQGGYGLDASLELPFALAIDRSGNVWVTNKSKGNLVKFFGLAAPSITPASPAPTLP